MDRKEHTEWLNSIEQRYPVNEWQINNTHVWPLIKVKLSLEYSKKLAVSKSLSPLLLPKQLIDVLKGLWFFAQLYLKKDSKLPSNFYCLASHFRYSDGQNLINRYYNQLIARDQKNKFDFKILDYSTTSDEYKNKIDNNSQTIFLDKIKYLALVLRTFSFKKYKHSTDNWKEFDRFLEEVKSKSSKNNLTRNILMRQYAYIDVLSRIYKIILKKYKVDNVYILCYYVSEMYAMNLAASDLGINNWDIQHGAQGNLNTAYANFSKIPLTGYKLLPKWFWCWDNDSAAGIKKWTQNQSYHNVEVKGNPWIEYVIQNLSSKIVSQKQIILYTLQPIKDGVLEDYIIKAISDTPEIFIWWLRLHPRQLEQKKELITLLKNNNIFHKVEIEKATTFPLPVILNNCFVHISNFSGAILEAYMLKKTTIIISPIGVESFPEVVDSEYSRIVLNENSEELLNEINSIKNGITHK